MFQRVGFQRGESCLENLQFKVNQTLEGGIALAEVSR